MFRRFGNSVAGPARSYSKLRHFKQHQQKVTSSNGILDLKCISTRHSSNVTTANDKASSDAFALTKDDIRALGDDIEKELYTPIFPLHQSAKYYFDGHGKSLRPVTVITMAKACNLLSADKSNCKSSDLFKLQRRVAMIAEMIHTASLMHDDVIDDADMRRGKPSMNQIFSDKQTILTGDYILSKASIALAKIGDCRVVELIASIIGDLVEGELMQLISNEDPGDRFKHYIDKTFKKTASLLAYSCEAVAHLSGCNENIQKEAFRYGRNLGIAFQLIDDALDFSSTATTLGKPVASDLQYGLATAPVLFASEEFPELNEMVLRRFQGDGDVEVALSLIKKSQGVKRTILLAKDYVNSATEALDVFTSTSIHPALVQLGNYVVSRDH